MSPQPALTAEEQHVNDAWNEHLRTEFSAPSADEAIATMVAYPRVNQVPVMIGGEGRDELYEFYATYFLPQIPPDTEMVPVSRTIVQVAASTITADTNQSKPWRFRLRAHLA
jgi:carboxymethylenebutenolidase